VARASVYTLLSLDRFARILGINPMHFAGAQAGDYFPLRNRCSDLWVQHSWQWADSVSREDLALAIEQAEREIAEKLGWWPAPRWVAQEVHTYPRFHRREIMRVREGGASIMTRWGKVIQAGRRAVTLIGIASLADGTLEYTDSDGDGFVERATITLPTELTDASEIKVYHAGHGAAQEWEIRSPPSRVIHAGNVVLSYHTWQMIRPELWEVFPTDVGPEAIDLRGLTTTPPDLSNLVDSVEVYREYTSTSEPSAEFYWKSYDQAGEFTVQGGCLYIKDAERGIVVPQPAQYRERGWCPESFLRSEGPDFVKVWYYAGALSQEWLTGADALDPLPSKWANAIAWMALARLERPLCSCGNVTALSRKYQNDLAAQSSTELQAQSYNVSPILVLECPFGTRLGEVLAWQAVRNERERLSRGGVV